MRRRAPRLAVALALATPVLAGCTGSAPSGPGGADGASGRDTAPAVPGAPLTGELVVLAAASLTEPFTTIGDDLMAENPGLVVVLSFAGSSALAQQVVSGAPADVLAAASPAAMTVVTDAGAAAGAPTTFATNTLQIAVPPGNPGGVTGLADLAEGADPDRTVALCAPEVPCGAAAGRVFAATGLTAAPDTLEQDVKAAVTKVVLDEVDAALVYRTDVVAAGDDVEGIEVPEAASVVNEYPVAVLADAANPAAAAAFVERVLGPEGRAVLTGAGFGAP